MLGRVVLALCLLLAGLAVVTLSALTATRQATDGAREIESEFAERVATERAVLAATENFRLAEQRMRSDDARAADAVAAPLAASDGRLAAAIAVTQRVNGRHEDETAGSAAIRAAYARYVATRNALAERRTPAGAGERLAASFRPLQRTLVDYGGEHYDEARADLRGLEAGSGGRRLHLALGVGLSLLGLVALVVLARGIVVRAREFSVFAGRVAGGDLVTRVTPRGTDELDDLGHSLNSMVEQLASASRTRGERLADDAAYRSTQDAFTEVLRSRRTSRRRMRCSSCTSNAPSAAPPWRS